MNLREFAAQNGAGTDAPPKDGREEKKPPSLWGEQERVREERERALGVYREYLENRKETQALQTEILEGLDSGEPLDVLFLKAMQALSLAVHTGDLYRLAKEKWEARSRKESGAEPPP